MSDDDESYGFEYSDDGMDDPAAVDIENEYYNSKGYIEAGEFAEALAGFKKVVEMEEGQSEWGFKAFKQIVKLQLKTGAHEDMLESYREMLTYPAAGKVTKNVAEKKINSLMDFMSACQDSELLQRFYHQTLDAHAQLNNERLWFKANMKLCELWFGRQEFTKLAATLKELNRRCTNADGTPDLKKATLLLEVYALEIQMYSAQQEYGKLKELYDKALSITSAIPHPRIMGIVRESGGKMHMREKNWEQAHTDFFEAFKSYDDAGSSRRIQCLKYLVLANMLMESDVDPFDAQETKPYRNDRDVEAMTRLVDAYQRKDIDSFMRVLDQHKASILGDPFVKPYMEDLMTVLRTLVLLNKLVGPYSRVRIPFLAQKIRCTELEAERLLASLIMDGRIDGHIDQVNGVLVLAGRESKGEDSGSSKHAQIKRWATALDSLQKALLVNVVL